MNEVVGIFTGGGGVFILGVLTWWSKMKIDKKSGEVSITEQQRLGFESLLNPLRDELSDLRGRVTTLEAEVRAERDLRERIVAFTRTLLWTWRRKYPDDPPPATPESIATYFD